MTGPLQPPARFDRRLQIEARRVLFQPASGGEPVDLTPFLATTPSRKAQPMTAPVHGQIDDDGDCVLGGLPPDQCADCRRGRKTTPRSRSILDQRPPVQDGKVPVLGDFLNTDDDLDEPDPHERLDRQSTGADLTDPSGFEFRGPA